MTVELEPEEEIEEVEVPADKTKSSLTMDEKEKTKPPVKELIKKEPTAQPKPEVVIKRALQQWLTRKTLVFLNEKLLEESTAPKSLLDDGVQSKYEALCSKLDLMQVQDQVVDKQFLESEKRSLKPVVAYAELQIIAAKESKRLGAFINGKWEYPDDDDDVEVREEKVAETAAECEDLHIFNPIVVGKNQTTLRRKIVMDYLDKGLNIDLFIIWCLY